ncbi:hypothetical protein Tco_1065902, partial [Tanacetum coccineum]
AIHRDLFPFSPRPYYATYLEGGVGGNCKFKREEWDAPHQPTLTILTKEVFKEPFVCKTVVDQFLTPREMVKEPLGKLASSDSAFAKAKAKGKERKKKIKAWSKSSLLVMSLAEFRVNSFLWRLVLGLSMGLGMHLIRKEFDAVLKKISQFVPGAQSRLAEVSPLANVSASRDTRVSLPMAKESTVTYDSSSLEFPYNTVPSSSTLVESERVSSGPNDVVVALSAEEKDDGLLPFSGAAEEAVAAPSRV